MTQSLVVVVTGMSGAGKTTAVETLEDLGFYCVDNLPPPVAEETLRACESAGMHRVALGIDVRVGGFLDRATSVVRSLSTPTRDVWVLFLDASDEALLRRFSSTRRPHPLSTFAELGSERAPNAVLDGVRVERELLVGLRGQADWILDTTELSVHELRRRVVAHFGERGGPVLRLQTRIMSFGFKYGLPIDADVLLDVRFLDNPYFQEELKDLPGTNPRVRDWVLSNPESQEFVRHAAGLLEFCIPRFEREGKSYVTVGIGCTGGRHRSVVLAEHLKGVLTERLNRELDVVHRDVDRVSGAQEGGRAVVRGESA
ncbi:MAG: RNase adapter RapZ [Polyangiaceae bacterium]|nr:RNase adapter RapZ [Polyangiaceae bacterium]